MHAMSGANFDEEILHYKHRQFRNDDFWKKIPAWKNVSRDEFKSHLWQQKNTIRSMDKIQELLGDRLKAEDLEDIQQGLKKTPMNIRMTPYVFSLMNWDKVKTDPLRKQFLPLASEFLTDHPFYMEDSLSEDEDSPVPTLTHRYPDKVLFLPVSVCPVYCLYCTRSRMVGGSTEGREKEVRGSKENWPQVFEYIQSKDAVEDVVISGGDASMIPAKQLKQIGETLLNIDHVRRIRVATKAMGIFPQKFITDDAYVNTLVELRKMAKERGKQIMVHTHFSSPNEITEWSKMAMDRLFSEDIIVRNQAVLQEGVNNDNNVMLHLTRQLGYMNIQPYYVFIHDMVPGCEHLRTTLREALKIEKAIRGTTGGYNTPTFVCDLPGGGGKRHVASYEYYDEENGISVWKAPNVKPGKIFTYFDPIWKLSDQARKRWADPKTREAMLEEAKNKVR